VWKTVGDFALEKHEIKPFVCRPGTLITARSHLIDRFVPDCEIVSLPQKTVAGGIITWAKGPVTFPRFSASKRKRFWRARKRSGPLLSEGMLFDFRLKSPENWAHFLNNHLPILFFIAKAEGLAPEDCTVVLPKAIPNYIKAAARLFGLQILCSDGCVEGAGITFQVSPWTGIRPSRAEWVRQSKAVSCIKAAQSNSEKSELPKRVFLSRQDTRTLENEAEIEAYLGKRGYVKVYAESLSVPDQFRLFQEAESVVAVHGAGLAPLLYCSRNAGPKNLIELLPCGHMTDVYRVMSQQVGCRWVGVRGKIKPEHISGVYDLAKPFRRHSLQSFEVDLPSLELAFDMIG
jgi:capsular polysaccharide biosynthesis protein